MALQQQFVRCVKSLRLNLFALCILLCVMILVNIVIFSKKYDTVHKEKLKIRDNHRLLGKLKFMKRPGRKESKVNLGNDASVIKSHRMTKEEMVALSKHYHYDKYDCAKIFDNVPEEVKPAVNYTKSLRAFREVYSVRSEAYMNMTESCEDFIKSRGYIMSSLTKEEEDFPIAYSIVWFRDPELFERLFRSVYRPQNFYCIHLDDKVRREFYEVLKVSQY